MLAETCITDPLCDSSKWRKVIDLNLLFAIDLNNYLLKKMIMKKYGRIVHISSISALENQGPPSYCASKAAQCICQICGKICL